MQRAPRSLGARSRALAPSLAAAVAVAASGVQPARAGDVPDAVLTGYQAGPGCPDRVRFVALLRSYLDPADVPEALPTFVVRLGVPGSNGPNGGSLRMSSPGQAAAERTVEAKSCDDAALALAYVAALAISPNARTGSGPPVAAPSAAPPSVSVSVSSVPSSSASVPTMPPPPATPPALPPPADVGVAAPGPRVPRWSFGAGGILVRGLAPGLAPGGQMGGERGWDRLAVGLELAAASRATNPAGAGAARFTLLVARVFGCPWVARPLMGLEVSPCLAFSGGRVAASASGLDRSATSAQAWLVPAARARLRWTIGGGFGLGLAGDLGAPLVRPTYRFDDPALTVHRVPALVGEVSLTAFWTVR